QAMHAGTDQVLISASAVGYYGDKGEEILNEDSTPGPCFLSQVCVDWEKEAFQAKEKNKRVVAMRFGPVFDKNGGPLSTMILAFKFFAGGPLASGKQWMSWVHIDDLLSSTLFILENKSINGPVNICTSHPVRNREFAKKVGKILKRPSFFKVPVFAIKLLMGEMGLAMTFSQKALPEKLLRLGFEFKYPRIQKALEISLK
ncbi:MAG: TIGR01777 family oxidoreductase, partial [Deltaproteobacteria bacterium]|nr:TIGR01777 family oxidoreductase [Deltaproteobacteria bacterium]